MKKRALPKPTEAELAILNVIWEKGPSTVRQVHEALKDERKTRYTTTLKLMQIMNEKGLVVRDESSRTHIYQSRLDQQQIQRQIAGDLLERVFGGSAATLVMQTLAAKKASSEELAEIRKLLNDFEERSS